MSIDVIQIGDEELYYKINRLKYIITFRPRHVYNEILDTYIENIYRIVSPLYNLKHLEHSNVCGQNTENICNFFKSNIDKIKIKIPIINFGKIIISHSHWKEPLIPKILNDIDRVYGSNVLTIGASYHALAYLVILIEDTEYHIAIETTICEPYKLQFYVGTNDEFNKIIKIRYQCNDFIISFDCEKHPMDIEGGKKITKRTKRSKCSNQKRTKRSKRKRTKRSKL